MQLASRWRLFEPILAGANLKDRTIACIGAGVGIFAAAIAGYGVQYILPALPFLIAPIGASAVLVFAVPASPLAQPWPVLGGNVVSAAVGVVVLHLVANPVAAVGIGVALAILIMSLLRCLHPPGGAAVLTAIIGGDAVAQAGFIYPLSVVAANSAALLCVGWLFHRVSGHSYPHRAAMTAAQTGLLRADIEQAIAGAGETFDIDPADLEMLLLKAETHAEQRRAAQKSR